MKTLCIVLDSDPIESWRATYDSHRSVWNRCLDANPYVDGFFVRSDPNQSTALKLGHRALTVRGEECFGTVLNKLTQAINELLDGHEYVIQTGLSSLYDFKLLQRRPTETGVYAGHLVEGGYVTGAGILMSSDVARLLVEGRHDARSEWQDVSIQQILHARGVGARHEEMFIFDYSKGLEQIEVGKHLCYRFRDYGDPQRIREREALRATFDKLYG